MDDEDKPKGGVVFGGSFGFASPGATAVKELPPFRLMIIGDFGGKSGTAPIALDPHGFKTLPKVLGVRVHVETPNLLGNEPRFITADLDIETPRDLAASTVLQSIPLIAAAREVIDAVKKGKSVSDVKGDARFSGLDKLVNALSAPKPGADDMADESASAASISEQAPSTAPAFPEAQTQLNGDGDPLDRLLNMVETPSNNAPHTPSTPVSNAERDRAARAVNAFIQASSKPKTARTAAEGNTSEAEALLGLQCQALLTDSEIRASREAWAGLRFLLGQTDFRSPVTIEILQTGPDGVAAAINGWLSDSENDPDQPNPAGAVVVAGRLKRTQQSFELLQSAARTAETIQTPIVFSLDNAFPTDMGFDAAGSRDDPGAAFKGPGFEPWEGMRDKEESRWITVAANDALIETATGDTPDLWLDAGFVLAALITRSVKATGGWPSEITGARNGIDGLELHTVEGPSRKPVAIPVRGLLGAHAARGLAGAGVAALAAKPDRDSTFLIEAPSLHRSVRNTMDRPTGYFESLPYQLVAARIAKQLSAALPELTAGRDAESAAAAVAHWLETVAQPTGPGARASAHVHPDPDDPSATLLSAEVRMGRAVLDGESFAFDFPI